MPFLSIGAIAVVKNNTPVLYLVYLDDDVFYTFYRGVKIHSYLWDIIFQRWKWSRWSIKTEIFDVDFKGLNSLIRLDQILE